jgi:hypothetical protein
MKFFSHFFFWGGGQTPASLGQSEYSAFLMEVEASHPVCCPPQPEVFVFLTFSLPRRAWREDDARLASRQMLKKRQRVNAVYFKVAPLPGGLLEKDTVYYQELVSRVSCSDTERACSSQ